MCNPIAPLNYELLATSWLFLWFRSIVGLCVVIFTLLRIYRLISVSLVGFLSGVGEASCMYYYLRNIGSLFDTNMENLLHRSRKLLCRVKY